MSGLQLITSCIRVATCNPGNQQMGHGLRYQTKTMPHGLREMRCVCPLDRRPFESPTCMSTPPSPHEGSSSRDRHRGSRELRRSSPSSIIEDQKSSKQARNRAQGISLETPPGPVLYSCPSPVPSPPRHSDGHAPRSAVHSRTLSLHRSREAKCKRGEHFTDRWT